MSEAISPSAPAESAPVSEQDAVNVIYGFAAQLMRDGLSNVQVESALMGKGLDPRSAATVVTQLDEARSNQIRSVARKNMGVGAAWCIGGILVTAITYEAAANGGTYVVAWGAIAFGALQFFRGLGQYLSRG